MKKSTIQITEIKYHKLQHKMQQSAEKSPFLGKVESNGVVSTDQLIDEMQENGCKASAETIAMVIAAEDRAVARQVGDYGRKVYTGLGAVSPHITGNFDSVDGNVGEQNEIVARVNLNAEARNALADITPKENTDNKEELGGPRILSVLTQGLDYQTLKGTLPFSVAGSGFKGETGTATAKLYLTNAKTGVETEVPTVQTVSSQRITGKLTEALPAGKYQLKVVITEGEEDERTERSTFRNVTMVA